jgi:hypothetical protein
VLALGGEIRLEERRHLRRGMRDIDDFRVERFGAQARRSPTASPLRQQAVRQVSVQRVAFNPPSLCLTVIGQIKFRYPGIVQAECAAQIFRAHLGKRQWAAGRTG